MSERPHRPSNIRPSRGTNTKAAEPNVHALALPPKSGCLERPQRRWRDACQLEREHHSGLRLASLPHPMGSRTADQPTRAASLLSIRDMTLGGRARAPAPRGKDVSPVLRPFPAGVATLTVSSSAQTEGVVSGDEMLVGAAKEVFAGAARYRLIPYCQGGAGVLARPGDSSGPRRFRDPGATSSRVSLLDSDGEAHRVGPLLRAELAPDPDAALGRWSSLAVAVRIGLTPRVGERAALRDRTGGRGAPAFAVRRGQRVRFAACSMTLVTALGSAIIERWGASISVMWAPALWAIES